MSHPPKDKAALRFELERLFTKIIERGLIDDELLTEIVAFPSQQGNPGLKRKEERA